MFIPMIGLVGGEWCQSIRLESPIQWKESSWKN